MDFNYGEEVLIFDAFNSKEVLGITKEGILTGVDNFMAVDYIATKGYLTKEALREALMEFKLRYKNKRN